MASDISAGTAVKMASWMRAGASRAAFVVVAVGRVTARASTPFFASAKARYSVAVTDPPPTAFAVPETRYSLTSGVLITRRIRTERLSTVADVALAQASSGPIRLLYVPAGSSLGT